MKKYKIYLCNISLIFLLLSISSCKKNIHELIAGEKYKIWDQLNTSIDGSVYMSDGCYFTTNGRFARFHYYDGHNNRQERRIITTKGGDAKDPGTWRIINAKTIEINLSRYEIIKLTEDTLHLYRLEDGYLPDLFLVKSKNQTPIEGETEMVQ
ncbi:MAG: hypothetical protein IAE67_00030 [Candidatus Competibacteraceae bacterium]|nr:hypothetical protein [Candidatus Competibacteraceae bacterium]